MNDGFQEDHFVPGDILPGSISQTVVLYRKSFKKSCVKGEDIHPGSCDSEIVEMS